MGMGRNERNWDAMREIILDTETTGLDPAGGDRIVEIAAIETIHGVMTDKKFHVYVDPEREIPDSAFRVHGISNEFIQGKPKFAEIAEEFLTFIGSDTLVAHNAEFDMRFLNAELGRLGRPLLSMDRVVDTLALARRKHPGASNSLDALCARYGVDRSKRVKHGALIDTEILAEVYIELRGGRQTTLALAVKKEARRMAPSEALVAARAVPLPQRLTDQDVAAHDAFVEKAIKQSLWLHY